MAFMVTATDIKTNTGLIDGDVDSFDSYITEATKEFEMRVNRVFSDDEDDYKLAQRAVSFLTAYYIRMHRQEIEYAKALLEEYHRLLKLLIRDMTPDTQNYWEPQIEAVTQEDLGDTSR